MKISSILAGLIFVSLSVPVLAQRQNNQANQRPSPEQAFANMDANNDGVVSSSEFTAAHNRRISRRARRQGDNSQSRPSAEQIFSRIDANRDGVLSKSELQTARNNRIARRADRQNQE